MGKQWSPPDCELCGERFDYVLDLIRAEMPDGKMSTTWACELCAEEFDADAQAAFDGRYNSIETGHPTYSDPPAPGGAPVFLDEVQCYD